MWYVGLRALSIYWSAFYGDYSVVTSTALEKSTSWACESLFKLLGLKFAEEGPKRQPFSSSFKMLGVVMNLDQSNTRKVTIGHTQERSNELAGNIAGHLEAGTISSKEAERLPGRMIFFEGFSFGRVACSAVKALGRIIDMKRHSVALDDDMRFNLEFLKNRVVSSQPIRIGPKLHQRWIILVVGACMSFLHPSPLITSGSFLKRAESDL